MRAFLLVLFLHAGCGGAQRDDGDTPARDRAEEFCSTLNLTGEEGEEFSIFVVDHYYAQAEILSSHCDRPEAATEMLAELDRCLIEASRPYLDDRQISRLANAMASRYKMSCME